MATIDDNLSNFSYDENICDNLDSLNEIDSNKISDEEDFSSHVIETEILDYKALASQFSNSNNSNNINKDFIILHLNVRSLNANIENLEIFLSKMNKAPSIIVCSETWFLPCPQYHNLNNYIMYYNNSQINKADGTVIFVKNDIKHSSVIETINKVNFLSVTIKFKNINLKITSTYRYFKLKVNPYIDSVNKFIKANKKIKNHIIIGDFNIDLMQGDTDSEEFINNFLENEYIPYFNQVTRPNDLNKLGGSCIDNAFIKSADFNQICSYKFMQTFTDHYPIFINIEIKSQIDNSIELIDSINYKKIFNLGLNFDWQSATKITDPNCALDYLIVVLQDLAKRATTSKKNFKFRKKNTWITYGIAKSCITKNKLYNEYNNNRHDSAAKNKYFAYLKTYKKVIFKAKLDHNSEQIKSKMNNARKLCKYINSKIKNTNPKPFDIDYLSTNNNIINDKYGMANEFNDFFGNVGHVLASKITNNNSDINFPENINNTFYIKPFSANEINKIIASMPIKAGGIDKINVKTLKSISKLICSPLSYIFNLFIMLNKWPTSLKSADIVPIYKQGDKHLTTNYRPISLISNLAKVFEKIIHNRLINFLNDNNVISKNQYGFLKNIGTKEALAKVSDLIYSNIDNKLPTIITFLDLAKAFDTVNHKILLSKLYRYRIRGGPLELLRDYLSNRLHRVKINNIFSDFKNVTIGVPQGTILGPLLFLLYINDIFLILPENCIFSNADDTAIVSYWTKIGLLLKLKCLNVLKKSING